MAFCGNCGAQIQDDTKFCPSCGAATGASAGSTTGAPAGNVGPAPVGPAAGAPVSTSPNGVPAQSYQQAAPPAGGNAYQQTAVPSNDAEANKGMAVLAYILFFVPLLAGTYKTSPFVKYHTNQGTILAIFAVALVIAENILLAILRVILLDVFYIWGAYSMLSLILNILWLAPTALCIIGIVNAVGGKTQPLPVIGDKFTILK